VDLQKNYYELFGLPVTFDLDPELLAERYRAVQSSVHPDRFAEADSRNRRLSLQYATLANEAFATLKSPLKRAIYLLQLHGRDVTQEGGEQLDPGFLMQQIELREALEEVDTSSVPEQELSQFRLRVREVIGELEADFVQCLDAAGGEDLDGGETAVRKMQFMHKLLQEADRVEERLLDL